MQCVFLLEFRNLQSHTDTSNDDASYILGTISLDIRAFQQTHTAWGTDPQSTISLDIRAFQQTHTAWGTDPQSTIFDTISFQKRKTARKKK